MVFCPSNDNSVITLRWIFASEFEHDKLLNTIKHFWETESIGIKEQIIMGAIEGADFLRDPSYDGEWYEVGLPWKEDYVPSANSFQMCSSHLKSLRNKLSQDPALLHEYDNIIKDQEKNGIIERAEELCSKEEINRGIHFSSPHVVVHKDRETTKVRIVYDGSAKSSKQGRSLNECLETGPNYIPHIFDMLAKFRWNSVGLTADIEKAFLNVGIKKEDQDMLRFLWFKDPTRIVKPQQVSKHAIFQILQKKMTSPTPNQVPVWAAFLQVTGIQSKF